MKAEYNIPLGNGKYATIDLEDLDKIQGPSWQIYRGSHQTFYSRGWRRNEAGKYIRPFLHQVILGEPPPGFEIGHRDGNGLNCKKSNLRFLTDLQNSQGARAKSQGAHSQYRGVTRDKNDKGPRPWRAQLMLRGERISLGRFDSEIGAAKAYDAGAIKYFGEYAAPNFPAQKENQCQSSINAGGAA